MMITKIEPLDKMRSKVLTDEDFAFVLYRGEIKRLGLNEGRELEAKKAELIKNDILLRRAKERALHLLKSGDKTERELSDRLLRGGYPEEIIGRTLEFLREYGLCDDRRYCRDYIASRIKKAGERDIREKLLKKGVGRDLIGECMEEAAEGLFEEAALGENESSESSLRDLQLEACRKTIYKKLGRGSGEAELAEFLQSGDERAISKLYAHLCRKGFSGDVIRECLSLREECCM